MRLLITVALLISYACSISLASSVDMKGAEVNKDEVKDGDVGLGMQLVTRWGYPLESYQVVTEDGYITTTFRIPHGLNEIKNENAVKPVVYLQHGVMVDSYTWVSNLPDQSLAFMLADAGFDVWMGNSRGTTPWGKGHTSLDPSKKPYWAFTYDQMAQYDIVANINYILAFTKAEKLNYVCHSQGCTSMMIGLTQKWIDPTKLNFINMMSPVTYIKHTGSLLLKAAADFHLAAIVSDLGFGEFLPSDGFLQSVLPLFCAPLAGLCDDVLGLLCGPSNNINKTRTDVYLAFTPAGSSVIDLDHWSQGIRSDNFEAYDWGTSENQKRYNQKTPTVYDLSLFPKDQVKVAVFYSPADYLANEQDVERMLASLPDGAVEYHKLIDNFSHMDFVWGINANQLVYNDVIRLCKEHMSLPLVNQKSNGLRKSVF